MTNLFYGLFFATVLFASRTYGDPLEKCQARNHSYAIGDTGFCDKYYDCGSNGKLIEKDCDDGFVFSLEITKCDYPHNVNCTERPELQPSKSTNEQCPRMNGFYAFPASESCQKFYHCLEGSAYEKTCPEGIIFDDTKGACVHPDMAGRKDCSASKVLDFICPNAEKRFSKLRFGDHDRHAHPSDCRKFYVCTRDGQPRIGGCPIGKVFNPKTGVCDQPKRVPNCKDYYGKKAAPKTEGDDVEEVNNDGSDSEASNSESDDENKTDSKQSPPSNHKSKTVG
ncbi:unnamed protein product [Allacma fusca]|uniref:Chitin-binding type-2 domain-containing protein n=1 Tax=Allacma fusca TaxID=39272 RepID=A0A8J2PCY2_9HEXA|nr:unnamed protein product [Allacma fusca]